MVTKQGLDQRREKIILSRDVIFQKKPNKCEEHVELPFKDIEKENEDQDQTKDHEESKEDNTQDDSEEDQSKEKEMESEDDRSEEDVPRRQLRDRSKLKKRQRLDDSVMMTMEFISGIRNPETYEEASSSTHSVH